MTKKLPPEIKQQRKPTRVACSFCHSKHLQCDDTRPCKNCVKRGNEICVDVERRKKKKKTKVSLDKPGKVLIASRAESMEPAGGNHQQQQQQNQQQNQNGSAQNAIHTGIIHSNSTTLGYKTLSQGPVGSETLFTAGYTTSNGLRAQQNPAPGSLQTPGLILPGSSDSTKQADTTNDGEVPVKRKRGRPRKLRQESDVQAKKPRNSKSKTEKTDKEVDNNEDKDNENSGVAENTGLNLINVNLEFNTNASESSNAMPMLHPTQQANSLPPPPSSTSHLPLLNLANVSLSGMNLDALATPSNYVSKNDNSLSSLLPSFSDLKSPKFDPKLFNMSLLMKDNRFPNSGSNFTLTDLEKKDKLQASQLTSCNDNNNNNNIRTQDSSLQPETPGSPLEFSVSSSSRTNTVDQRAYPLHDHRSSRPGSLSNFESNLPNDEFDKLKSRMVSNPPTPNPATPNFMNNVLITNIDPTEIENSGASSGFYDFENIDGLSNFDTIDDDEDVRPFIMINLDDGTMISSYPNNSTPNSYVYNADHSLMKNTAKEIPQDFEQNEDYTSPLIMRHVIKQPDDIYLTNIVKAYRYPKAYHALIAYLKKRFNKMQLIEIAKCMAKYRPSFISATKNLFENDLIFTERSFQRTLLEYENLISMSPSPTIIWRRTGEIVALTNEFAVMTGYSKMSLLTKRTFIVELMDDESTINYFKSFSEFAFGDLNATHLTDCNLRKADDNNYLRCSCVWTIKRDVFDIPMLIVGQFLPVLE